MSVEKILYIMSCQHVTLAPAFLVSGTLHCPLCHTNREIRDVQVMEWRTKCHSCKYARWAGMSDKTALMFADAHVRHNPGHNTAARREPHLAATKTQAKMAAWRVRAQS